MVDGRHIGNRFEDTRPALRGAASGMGGKACEAEKLRNLERKPILFQPIFHESC